MSGKLPLVAAAAGDYDLGSGALQKYAPAFAGRSDQILEANEKQPNRHPYNRRLRTPQIPEELQYLESESTVLRHV
jgi:hypothetical protein